MWFKVYTRQLKNTIHSPVMMTTTGNNNTSLIKTALQHALPSSKHQSMELRHFEQQDLQYLYKTKRQILDSCLHLLPWELRHERHGTTCSLFLLLSASSTKTWPLSWCSLFYCWLTEVAGFNNMAWNHLVNGWAMWVHKASGEGVRAEPLWTCKTKIYTHTYTHTQK